MKPLRDFGISRRYNNEESPSKSYRNTLDRSRGRESLYDSRNHFSAQYINNPQNINRSLQPNYYTTSAKQPVLRQSEYVRPFVEEP